MIVDGTGSVLDMIKMPRPSFTSICGTAVEAVLLDKLPIQLEYLNTPATAGHARLPARVNRAALSSFDELLAMVDDLDGETAKFDLSRRPRRQHRGLLPS